MKRLALLAVLVAACGGVGPRYTDSVRVADNRLVAVNPDVKTVMDADQPVFYVRGAYWLFADGNWFRSARVDGKWQHVAKPPVAVAQIDQPFAFVHFKNTNPGRDLETVATGNQGQDAQDAADAATPAEPKRQPTKERQGAAVDPSVDPTVNLAPALD